MDKRAGALTDVVGITVGHFTDQRAATGCTVVLCGQGAVAAVDVRGAAPATRETDLLRPENSVQRVHAVLLTGGSAFGLAAADGVMRFLEEHSIGLATSAGLVPIVPAASLYDLGIGDPRVRPGPADGYAACLAASKSGVEEGSVGAGTGATVGHLRGGAAATKAGVGTASQRLRSGHTVAALAAVNAFGDIVEPKSGRVVAGTRLGSAFMDPSCHLDELALGSRALGEHTTLAVVATDAELSRPVLLRVAQMAHAGLSRTITPVHTAFDGDLVFSLATGTAPTAESTLIGAAAAEVLSMAVLRAVSSARGLAGIPSSAEFQQQ